MELLLTFHPLLVQEEEEDVMLLWSRPLLVAGLLSPPLLLLQCSFPVEGFQKRNSTCFAQQDSDVQNFEARVFYLQPSLKLDGNVLCNEHLYMHDLKYLIIIIPFLYWLHLLSFLYTIFTCFSTDFAFAIQVGPTVSSIANTQDVSVR